MEELRRIDVRGHKIVIEGRERATITSVEDVDSFNENEVIMLTGAGMITVEGEDLHISKLNVDEGLIVVDGLINSIDYSDHEEQRMQGKGFFNKMFK